jgi:uncharacterized protein YyaL (SSP411 family)
MIRGLALALIAGLALAPSGQAQAGRLTDAASPYLQAHAGDAIDWRPWSADALALARREEKLIFLSIGYASCHWCHVQARTTFADPRVIELLNESFVSILVDREERPDLDRHFMAIMAAMTGESGWPANFFLTPDAVPLSATGYLAPEPEYGRPGFVAAAGGLARAWATRRPDMLADAAEIRAGIEGLFAAAPAAEAGGGDPRDKAAEAWSKRFDEAYGGFGRGAKFTHANVLSFLLRNGARRRDPMLLENVFETLDQMAAGALRDQLGGGFHRFTVDRFWQQPHFEMALNHNALLARLYLAAYRLSGRPRHAAVARGILDALLARFRLGGGGFASALDADSAGREGAYYTWTEPELRTVLGAAEAERFAAAYLDPDHGRGALRLLQEAAAPARFAASRARLLEARQARPPPARDEKVLSDWNALAVSAFAQAAQVLDEGRYARVAQEEGRRLLATLADGGGLIHARLGDRLGAQVFLDDYAFLAEAFVDLYETDFDIAWLEAAHETMTRLIERFQGKPGAPFHFTPLGRSSAISARVLLAEDGAPSGNAVALTTLHRLALFGQFEAQARAIAQTLAPYLAASAALAPGLLRALGFTPTEAHEIVIVGLPEDPRTQALLREARARPLRGTVVALIPPGADIENKDWPLLAARPLIDEKPTAYVCRQRLCKLPVNNPEDLAAQLDALFPRLPG